MPTLAPDPRSEAVTAAETLAAAHWRANLAALSGTRAGCADLLSRSEVELEWVFGRDGTLTGRTPAGLWWADCSVPLLAGRSLLSTLEQDPLSSCLLAPGHVGLVLAARERMGPGPALIVVQPDAVAARVILGCHDFSADIAGHRLWFVCGPDWESQLREVFAAYPGLATPARFIRTKLTPPETADELIEKAQAIFSAVLEARGTIIREFQSRATVVADPLKASEKILLVGGSRFRLWDAGTSVLAAELADQNVRRFDNDDPLSTSPIALLEAARGCGSVVSADICRADATHLVPMNVPWVTWMTRPAAPPFSSAGGNDVLILADGSWRKIARAAGWPEDRLRVCGWPKVARTVPHQSIPKASNISGSAVLGILSDTRAIEIPESIDAFSSHRVLWEMIEAELRDTPLLLEDADEYLRDRAGQLNVDIDTLDRARFINELILPAYQQGLVRLLTKAGVAVRAWGAGWLQIPEFRALAAGTIENANQFSQAVAESAALLHCWPTNAAHPIEMTNVPLVYRVGREAGIFIANAKRTLAAGLNPQRIGPGERIGPTVLQALKLGSR